MTRQLQTNQVYRDSSTGRLIPRQVAGRRDPESWVEEEFLVIIDQATDQSTGENAAGRFGPPERSAD